MTRVKLFRSPYPLSASFKTNLNDIISTDTLVTAKRKGEKGSG